MRTNLTADTHPEVLEYYCTKRGALQGISLEALLQSVQMLYPYLYWLVEPLVCVAASYHSPKIYKIAGDRATATKLLSSEIISLKILV